MVYSTRRSILCLTLCYLVLVFFSPFSIAITSLGLERECFSYVCSIWVCLDLSVSSSSWCLGRAAVCDCGTPWTFLLPFFFTLIAFTLFSLYLLVHALCWFTVPTSTSLCLGVWFYLSNLEHSYPNGMCLCYLVYTSWHMLCAGVLYQLALACAWVYDSTSKS